MDFRHICTLKRKLVQKGSQNRGGKNPGIFILRATWPPDWSQELGMSPQDRFGPQNDPKMMSRLPQNGTVGKRNHSNTSRHLREGWNREGNPKVVSEKKWREFRPCRSHFSVAKRRQSTQRARKVHRKIGESSVSANGCFLSFTGYTVRSR